ncbi:hypothetical protein [Paraburkholderia lacunae]|nr:hypothetical protein [Paraburkholderia lacunae]
MSTPQEDFQHDPYDFLSNNVVYPNISVLRQEYLLPNVGGEAFVIRPAPVIPVTVKKVPNASSTTGGVFALVRAGDKDHFPLRAYYLPYMQNKTCGGVLHKSAEWMFTAAMDGCTFGAGSVTADGVCLAVHANAASAGQGGRDEQRRQQDEQIATTFSTLGSSKTMSIAPSNYMSDGGGGSAPAKISATTFGKRSGDKWEFFVLRFTSKKAGDDQFMREYLHKGIIGATS